MRITRAASTTDAITASKRYLQHHPASKDAAYAQYLMAMSYYNQIPDVTRDQEQHREARSSPCRS